MERIAKFVLTKHSKESKNQDFTNDDIEEWMRKLGVFAYEKQGGTERTERNPSFDTHLAILFKEGEDGTYDFVHATFYEHFLARHVANSEHPSTIVMDWKRSVFSEYGKPLDRANRKAWKARISTVSSVVEMLANGKETAKLAEMAHELISDPNDDEVGTGFFL